MNRFRIAGPDDVRRIEAGPYEAFMRHVRIGDALAETAARFGERPALTYIVSDDPAEPARTWTHAALHADIRRAAGLFRRLAGSETPRVAMLLPAIPQAYLTLWGAECSGTVCPINYLLDGAHIAELLRASGANILVVLGPNAELDIASKVPALVEACPTLCHVLSVGAMPGATDFDTALAAAVPDDTSSTVDTVALFHTGGTTGAPKLARHTHRNQLHAAWGAAQMYGTTERDVMLNGFPLFHVAGSFVFGLSTLLSGGEVVLPTLLGMRNAGFMKRYWRFVERHRVTQLAAVPTVIGSVLAVPRDGADTSSVRHLLTGGSPLPNELAANFERTHGIPVRNILGMTECAGVISIEPAIGSRTPGSCGLPLPFTTVVAMREDGGQCQPGETGVLRVRGPNVGPGYTDPKRDTGTFEDGWLITGDLGHVDEHGAVFVTGRAKDVIIRSGHNIDPGVIEEALMQCEGVVSAAAVGEPDAYAGEVPVAFVAVRPGTMVDLEALQRRIPERPAFPKRVDIVEVMPLTAVGKIYKPALRVIAVRRALQARLDALEGGSAVRLEVHESASGPAATFEPLPPATREDAARIASEVMAPFALPFHIHG